MQHWLWLRSATSLDEADRSQLEQKKKLLTKKLKLNLYRAVERSSHYSCIWNQCQRSSKRQGCHMVSTIKWTDFGNRRILTCRKEDRETMDRLPRLPKPNWLLNVKQRSPTFPAYRNLCKSVKTACRKVSRKWLAGLSAEADQLFKSGNT